MQPVTALSDAAILYGAQRYFDGLHDQDTWPYRGQYRKEDDRALFVEFLHNLCLYDRIVLDNRPIDHQERLAYSELNRFLENVNELAGKAIFQSESLAQDYGEQARAGTRSTDAMPTTVQGAVCKLVASYIFSGQTARIEAVSVPWAYHQPFHQDWHSIAAGLQRLQIPERWIPFTLFVWRAIWYGAIARFQAQQSRRPFAYVAAPRRISALEAVLDSKTLAVFQFPREAVRTVCWELPGVPSAGYDFGYLDFVSPFEVSALNDWASGMSAENALRSVVGMRRSAQGVGSRRDWADILLEGAATCLVGPTVIQIMRDVTVHGNASQTVRLRALPSGDSYRA